MVDKVCFLSDDPEEFEPGVWSLRYAPLDWYEKHPDHSLWYTSVTREKCPLIEEFKKGDKIVVNVVMQKVLKVRLFEDPFEGLYIL